jgi:hypothetical protein
MRSDLVFGVTAAALHADRPHTPMASRTFSAANSEADDLESCTLPQTHIVKFYPLSMHDGDTD